MSENLTPFWNLLFVIAGGLVGFLGSLGFAYWNEQKVKRELKSKIREELEIIQNQVRKQLEKEPFHIREFFTFNYPALSQDLIRKLDAKTCRAILQTYIIIDSLKLPFGRSNVDFIESVVLSPNIPALSDEDRYAKAVKDIQATIDLLK